jgi:hypothetical protein
MERMELKYPALNKIWGNTPKVNGGGKMLSLIQNATETWIDSKMLLQNLSFTTYHG